MVGGVGVAFSDVGNEANHAVLLFHHGAGCGRPGRKARPACSIRAAVFRLWWCLAFSFQLDCQIRPGLLAFGIVRAREIPPYWCERRVIGMDSEWSDL